VCGEVVRAQLEQRREWSAATNFVTPFFGNDSRTGVSLGVRDFF